MAIGTLAVSSATFAFLSSIALIVSEVTMAGGSMFETQIIQTRDILRRINLAIDNGLDTIPRTELVYRHEVEDWKLANKNLILHSFGRGSEEIRRYYSALASNDYFNRFPNSELRQAEMKYQRIMSLLNEFEEKFKASQFLEQTHVGELVMGDKYITGQAGAVGPGAGAHDITFNQVWAQVENTIPLERLTNELGQLRLAMKQAAISADEDIAVGAVAAAEQAAIRGSGPKTLEYLRAAGEWGLQIAEKIGVEIAVAAIKSSLGL
ncbi:hypothetical protein [Caballeronia sp. GaOx3]|uniref:hypothetical protein n=1 Tax=Caballeronia sp. GaOx3 TaxID=2921740 RepID=UPI0020282369|nr:hypothetical protein [Caballeronia sp. GaOx3]